MKDVLRNTWYVAAWASEVPAGALLARTFLDEPVVMFRDADGQPTALMDRCPHRFAPLSMGTLKEQGASVECPYHGLRFDAQGQCVFNPHGDGKIPKAAHVHRYPMVERYSALWIWMGEPARADAALIPEFDFLVPETWAVGTGHMAVDGHYELESDNILDLSHIEFLHPLFASEGVRRGTLECIQEGEAVWSKRMITRDTPTEYIYNIFNVRRDALVDRWLDVRWHAPALMALWTGGVESGQPREAGVTVPTAHLFTPKSQTRTHYFYAMSFPRSIGPMAETLAQDNVRALQGPFEREDKPMIEAVQQRMAGQDLLSLKPVLLAGDAAGMRARRLLRERILAESASQA